MKRAEQTTTTILPIVITVCGIILTFTYKIMGDVPKSFYILVITFMTLLAICWLGSLLVVVKSYNKDQFDEIEKKISRSAQQIKVALSDIHVTSVHEWIISDTKLNEEYESKVPNDKAIIIVTPTFRNDYPQGDESTGMDFTENVAKNIARGVKYRYLTDRIVAERHFEDLIRHHKKLLPRLSNNSIKVFVTSVPQITEMVLYPLPKAEAFTIIKTEMHPIYKTAEYNVKMVKHELEQFKAYLRYLLDLEDTEVWEFDSNGRRVKHKINDDDRTELFQLTDVPI
jgi:hypothetical protein